MPETAPSPAAHTSAPTTAPVRAKPPRELYASTCIDLNCKCNSALEQMLPGADDPVDTVTSLDLHLNLVGNLGCQALLPAVLHLPALTSLNLSANQLENACATALAAKLSGHRGLQRLDLSDNPISHAGGKQLLHLATQSPSLQHIGLDGTLINPALKKRIDSALAPRRPAAEQSDTPPAAAVATSAPASSATELLPPPDDAAASDRLHTDEEEAAATPAHPEAPQSRGAEDDQSADVETPTAAKDEEVPERDSATQEERPIQVVAPAQEGSHDDTPVVAKETPTKRAKAGDSLKQLFAVESGDALPALATVAMVVDRRAKKAAEKAERRLKARRRCRKREDTGSDDDEEDEEDWEPTDSDDY